MKRPDWSWMLEPELIGLIGVVVGAILGGLAQVVAARAAARATHRQWLRERQEASYTAFLADWDRRYNALNSYEAAYGPDPPEDYLVALWDLMSRVELYGTPAARRLARAAFDRLRDAPSSDGTLAAYEAFRNQARLDLTK